MSKFDDAYCIATKTTIAASDLLQIEMSNPMRYALQFKSNLYCPSCHKAQVTFVHGVRPFFRTYPKARHDDKCSLTQEEMGREETASFVHENLSRDEIDRQMTLLLSDLVRNVASEGEYNIGRQAGSTASATVGNQSNKNRKRMPVRNITTQLGDDDIETYKLFYGRVKIIWEDDTNGKGKKILVCNPSTGKMVCRIWVSKKVFSYLDPSMCQSTNCLCCIVFLAELKPVRGKMYYRCNLEWSSYLKIAPMTIKCQETI